MGPSEYSRCRVQSPLVVLTAWHKNSLSLVIGPLHCTQTLSQMCDSRTKGDTIRDTQLTRITVQDCTEFEIRFTLEGTEH